MMDLMGLYRLAEDNDIAVDCFELKKREALSVMDNDGACYIASIGVQGVQTRLKRNVRFESRVAKSRVFRFSTLLERGRWLR